MNSKNWWRLLRAFWRTTSERNLDLIAAGIAFYGMLAIFPAVAAVIALWGFVSDPGERWAGPLPCRRWRRCG